MQSLAETGGGGHLAGGKKGGQRVRGDRVVRGRALLHHGQPVHEALRRARAVQRRALRQQLASARDMHVIRGALTLGYPDTSVVWRVAQV